MSWQPLLKIHHIAIKEITNQKVHIKLCNALVCWYIVFVKLQNKRYDTDLDEMNLELA
jgi:hypothetical protein